MPFEWDPAKAVANESKHYVSFVDAIRVFDDPLALTIQDRYEDGEERWQTIGIVAGIVLLVVAYTLRGEDEEITRLLSARRATKVERRAYEQG